MQKLTANTPETQSADLLTQNISQLKELFPEAFTEGKIDFDVLRQLLGGAVDEREEKFGLNWHGKRQARQLALTPSTGTLRPYPDESVDWDKTQNLIIEGDNLEVLKLLQKSYAGRVKFIHIDPPYNTGQDFIYKDNFRSNIRNYLEHVGQITQEGVKLASNTETSGRFHTDWLNMLFPRLKIAYNLLRRDGVIFITIDDHEFPRLRNMMDEIFGEENFVATAIWEKADSPRNSARQFSEDHDYILVYSRSPEWVPERLPRTEEANAIYTNPDDDPRGEWIPGDPYANKPYSKGLYKVTGPTGRVFSPPPGRYWRISEEKFWTFDADGRIWWGPTKDARPSIKRYLKEVSELVPRTLWKKEQVGSNRTSKNELRSLFPDSEPFSTPKPVSLIEQMLRIATDDAESDIVLDFFAGSGTTGHAVMALNTADGGIRRFILVQLPEPTGRTEFSNITEITRERIRRAAKKLKNENPMFAGDLGFRSLKLDSSNIRAWEPDRKDLAGSLEEHALSLKVDRTEQDILFELLLKLGLDLCVPIVQRTIAGRVVYSIGGGALLVCLAESISHEVVEELAHGIAAWGKEQTTAGAPRVVFRDSAFADDVAKTNLTAILQQHDISDVRSL